MNIKIPSTVPFSTLLTRSLQVSNETTYEANTAQRIGQLFYDIVKKMQVGVSSLDTWDTEQELPAERMLYEDVQDMDVDVQRAINDTTNAMTTFAGMQSGIVTLQNITNQLDTDLRAVEDAVNNIRTDVSAVENAVNVLQNSVVTQGVVDLIDNAISEIETTLVSLKSRTAQLETKVDVIINP